MTQSVAVAAVTFDRPRELAVLLDAINNQTAPVRSICLVDSGTAPAKDVAEEHGNVDYVRSEANLGGA
ncbi:MAG: glycosyltransferase, partial [Arthrobacter sp.]|nr:glycosyltransferase [Arthrobacter sp.]